LSCNKLTLVGGGRWASIILQELVKSSPHVNIEWVVGTKYRNQKAFIDNSQAFKRVTVIRRKEFMPQDNNESKLIVASHSSFHIPDLQNFRLKGQDTLIEKPLYPSINMFESLPKQSSTNLFLNLELFFAYFIRDFYKEVQHLPLNELKIIWHDPISEKRDSSKKKYSEIFSSIFFDQLLHVMSILKVFNIEVDNVKNFLIDSKNNSENIEIKFSSNQINISISLSRFSKKRSRKIFINESDAELDFTHKPNFYLNRNFIQVFSCLERQFPVAQTLKHFIEFPREQHMQPLSVKELMPYLKFCFLCEEEFILSFEKRVFRLSSNASNNSIQPCLVYFASIMYYRELTSGGELFGTNHFLTDNKGLEALKNWWVKFAEKTISNKKISK